MHDLRQFHPWETALATKTIFPNEATGPKRRKQAGETQTIANAALTSPGHAFELAQTPVSAAERAQARSGSRGTSVPARQDASWPSCAHAPQRQAGCLRDQGRAAGLCESSAVGGYST